MAVGNTCIWCSGYELHYFSSSTYIYYTLGYMVNFIVPVLCIKILIDLIKIEPTFIFLN